MSEKDRFYLILKSVRTGLFWERFVKEIHYLLVGFSLSFFIGMIVSRFFVIPFAEVSILIGFAAMVLLFILRISFKKPSLEDAARLINNFVPEDRVITAYHYRGRPGHMETLLMKDAVRHMEHYHDTIKKRKKQWFYPKMASLCVLFFFFGSLSVMFPNEKMQEAEKIEKEIQITEDLKKDLQRKMEEEKSSAIKQILMELEKELADVKTPEEIKEKLEKEWKETIFGQLNEKEKLAAYEVIKERLREGGLTSLANALESKNPEEISEILTDLRENYDQLSLEQKGLLDELAGSSFPDVSLSDLQSSWEGLVQSEEALEYGESKEQEIMALGRQMEKRMEEMGLSFMDFAFLNNEQNNLLPGRNQDVPPANSSGENSGQNEGSVPESSGDNPSSGETGSSNGQEGSGGGGGPNSGAGEAGAGLGSSPRNFLTFPDKIDGRINLENDFGPFPGRGEGDQFELDSPASKGSLRSYEEVYMEYERAYLESLNRVQLPKDLEEIIKNYFSSVKP